MEKRISKSTRSFKNLFPGSKSFLFLFLGLALCLFERTNSMNYKYEFFEYPNFPEKTKKSSEEKKHYLRHIFHSKEEKSLDISSLWNYSFLGEAFKDGASLTRESIYKLMTFKRNVEIKMQAINNKRLTKSFLKIISNEIKLFSFSDEFWHDFTIQRRFYDVRTLTTSQENTHMGQYKDLKCLSHATYSKETFFLCVQRVAGFEFYSATKNEQLVVLRCLHQVKSCRKYTFNYGAQAYFLWIFNRFFGKFSSQCKFSVNDVDKVFDIPTHLQNNLKAELKKLKDRSRRDLIQSQSGSPFGADTSTQTAKIINFFDQDEKEDVGHKFDHCFLKNTFLARVSTQAILIGFTPMDIPGSIYIELEFNNDLKSIEVKNNKEASFIQTSVRQLVHLDFDLVLVVEDTNFFVGSEKEFIKNLANLRAAELNLFSFDHQKYLSHYLNLDKFQLFVYSISKARNVYMYTFEVGSQGRIAYVNSMQLIVSIDTPEVFLFIHKVKSIFIFGMQTTNILDTKIKICINYSIDLPFKETCSFHEWVRLSRKYDMDHFQIDFIEQNDRVIMFFDNQFVTVFFREPLYEIVLHEDDPYVLEDLQSPSLDAKSAPAGDPVSLQAQFSLDSSKYADPSQLCYRYEIQMKGIEKDILLILETTLAGNPLWLENTRSTRNKQSLMIDKKVTFLPELKGNFNNTENLYMTFNYSEETSMFISLEEARRSNPNSSFHKMKSFSYMEHLPQGFLKIAPQKPSNQKNMRELILFERTGGAVAKEYFGLVRKQRMDYTLLQFDQQLQKSRVKALGKIEGAFLGTMFGKELLFYDGDNFYTKLADFDQLESNTNILKVKCGFIFILDYDPGISILFCFHANLLKGFIRTKDSRIFDGPFNVDFRLTEFLNHKKFGGIRCLSKYSKIIVEKTHEKEQVHKVIFYLVKIEKVIMEKKSPKEPKKEEDGHSLLDLGEESFVQSGYQSFSEMKQKKAKAKASGKKGEGLEERHIRISKIAEWDVRSIIETISRKSDFRIKNVIVMEKRIFVLIFLKDNYSVGYNFRINEQLELILLYDIDFQKMINRSPPVGISEVISKLEYPTDDFNRNLILLRAYDQNHSYIVHFYPERSYLQAFPVISSDDILSKGNMVVPIRLNELLHSPADDPFEYRGSESTQSRALSITFFIINEINSDTLFFEKIDVTRDPFLVLKDDSFKKNTSVTIYNGDKSDKVRFYLNRFEDGKANMLQFVDANLSSGFVDLENMSQFPVEIQVDLHNIKGNIFSYSLVSENRFESESGLIKMNRMVTEKSIFKGPTGSLMNFNRVALDKEGHFIYLYNKNLLWIISQEGQLVRYWFINKYLTCSSRLLQEFDNSTERENVFYDPEKNLMVRIIQSKKISAVVVYRVETPFSKNLDVIDALIDSQKEMVEFRNYGLKLTVINERLITENLLTMRFMYSDDILMTRTRDSNKPLLLYYWKNLVRNVDCPVSISINGFSHFRYKVLKSIVFSPDFTELDDFAYEAQHEEHLFQDPFRDEEDADEQPNSLERQILRKYDEEVQASEFLSMNATLDKSSAKARSEVEGRLLEEDSGNMADEESEFDHQRELRKRRKKKRKPRKIERESLKSRLRIDNSESLAEQEILVVALLKDAQLEIKFFQLKDNCFTLKANVKKNLKKALNKVKVDRLHLMVLNENLHIAFVNKNYHHFIVKLSYSQIHHILYKSKMFQVKDSSYILEKFNQIRNELKEHIQMEQIQRYQRVDKDKKKKKKKRRPAAEQKGKMDSEEQSYLQNIEFNMKNELMRNLLRVEKEVESAQASHGVPDIMKKSSLESAEANKLHIGPSGISEIDFALHSGQRDSLRDSSNGLRINSHKYQLKTINPFNAKIPPYRSGSKEFLNSRKKKMRLVRQLNRLEDLINERKPSEGSFDLKMQHYYLNNPFQIHHNLDKTYLSSLGNIIVLIENVDGVRKLIIYDLWKESIKRPIVHGVKPFDLETSVGTIYVHELREAMCQADSKKVIIVNFFQTQTSYNFLLLCQKKIFLINEESFFSSKIISVQIPKTVSLTIHSSTLNSKYFEILFKNSNHGLSKKILLTNTVLEEDKQKSITFRMFTLLMFCLSYLFILILLFGINWRKLKQKKRSKKKKTRDSKKETISK